MDDYLEPTVFKYELFLLRKSSKKHGEPNGDDDQLESIQDEDLSSLLRLFEDGEFERILCDEQMGAVWQDGIEDVTVEDVDSALKDTVYSYLSNTLKPGVGQLIVLMQGVVALQLAVQSNWTGPPCQRSAIEILNFLFGDAVVNFLQSRGKTLHDHAVSTLAVEESFHTKMHNPEYLWLARLLLTSCCDYFVCCKSRYWWALRCLSIHQQTMDDKSPALREVALQFIEHALTVEPLMTDDKYVDLQIQFHLEAATACDDYYEISKAKEHVRTAQKLAGLTVSLTGALGKRTFHQQDDKAQLVLQVETANDVKPVESSEEVTHLPKDMKLNDNVRMDSIAFKDKECEVVPNLRPEDQALLLNMFSQIRRSNAVHKLIDEELLLYLTTILSQPQVWTIQMVTLFYRSLMESKHHRTVERAMMQLQELGDSFDKREPTVYDRLHMFYCVVFPPYWLLQKKLADLLCSVGAVSSALDIYLRLERWDDVIVCYHTLQRRHKAEEIIRQQLDVKETPTLWCCLGDATDNPDHYVRAWELSNQRSARAQRGLGQLHFNKKEYKECIPHFQKAVEINQLQLGVWSTLAYAAMQVEDWELTARAYRHCLNLEPDNFQAWNNLSNAYIKLNQKPRAWRALQEALRCSYDDWRIWENFLLVSTDCGEFEEMISAYHRVLDLKGKHIDLEVLTIVVRAIAENIPDSQGVGAERLQHKALELFGRLTSMVTTNGHVWKLYAQLTAVKADDFVAKEKVLQYLQRAHRFISQQTGWEQTIDSCHEVVSLSLELANAHLDCCKHSTAPRRNILYPAQLELKRISTKMKQYYGSLLTDIPEDIILLIETLDEKINEIMAIIEKE